MVEIIILMAYERIMLEWCTVEILRSAADFLFCTWHDKLVEIINVQYFISVYILSYLQRKYK